jgi:uncharacterized protein YjfI (DUF2170 family)
VESELGLAWETKPCTCRFCLLRRKRLFGLSCTHIIGIESTYGHYIRLGAIDMIDSSVLDVHCRIKIGETLINAALKIERVASNYNHRLLSSGVYGANRGN